MNQVKAFFNDPFAAIGKMFSALFFGFLGMFTDKYKNKGVAEQNAPAKKIDPDVLAEEVASLSSLSGANAMLTIPDEDDEEIAIEIIDNGDLAVAYVFVNSRVGDVFGDDAVADLRRETGLSPLQCQNLVNMARDYDQRASA